MTIEFF